MDSITFKVYSKMFPKSEGELPSFDHIDTSCLYIQKDIELTLKSLVVEQSIDLLHIDINDFLKLFKKESYDMANNFINDAVKFYFSHPDVLSAIQGGRTKLFPNYRSLPDIDYDLLIPVFEKGSQHE